MQNPAQSSLTSFEGQPSITMSSLEMVEYINSTRAEGEAKLAHSDFLKKVPMVLGEDAGKFSRIYQDSMNRSKPCYHLPKREACLMAMSYSYELQARVFDHMTALEAKLSTTTPTALPSPTTQARQIIEDDLHVASLFSVPLHFAQSESVKHARLLTGVDYSHLLAYAPAQNDIQYAEMMLEPTPLGARYGVSGVKMNRMLQEAGLQVRVGRDREGTPAAKGQYVRHHWVDGNKDGYNLKWNVNFVEQALGLKRAA